jgi:hypothetical protein
VLGNAPGARVATPAASASITVVANNGFAGQVVQTNPQAAAMSVTALDASVSIKSNANTAVVVVAAQQASTASLVQVFANAQTANVGFTAAAASPIISAAASLAQITATTGQPAARVLATLGLATLGVGAQNGSVVTGRVATADTANIGVVANDPTPSVGVVPLTATFVLAAMAPDVDVPPAWGTITRVSRLVPMLVEAQRSLPEISLVETAGASMDEVVDRRVPEIIAT